MSFLVAGRDKDAPKFSRAILLQLKTAAESVGLTGAEAWRSDFGLGYIFRHSRLGLEKAKADHWSGWFQKNYPSESLVRATFLDATPSVFGIERDWLVERYDGWLSSLAEAAGSSSAPESGFVHGVIWADRVWHSYQRDVRLIDPISIEIQALEKRYYRLFGSWFGNLTGFRVPSRYYKFLVANTLGPRAFNKTFSDAELTHSLTKKPK